MLFSMPRDICIQHLDLSSVLRPVACVSGFSGGKKIHCRHFNHSLCRIKEWFHLGISSRCLYYALIFCLATKFFKQIDNSNMSACMLKHLICL